MLRVTENKIMENPTKSNLPMENRSISNILRRCTENNRNTVDIEILKELLDSVANITVLDSSGGTVIHKIISDTSYHIKNYAEIIKELTGRGIDIDHQNKKGETALHVAAIVANHEGALGLLKNGADINITDASGKTPFAISYKKSSYNCDDDSESDQDSCEEDDYCESFDNIFKLFMRYMHKLRYCDRYINELNRQLLNKGAVYKYLRCSVFDRFHNEVERTKTIAIESLMTSLYDFLFKLDSETLYLNMVHSERQEVDEFFENVNKHDLPELYCILQLRYKEITQKVRLTDHAAYSLIILIDRYQIPDLCCRHILKYLTIYDLKSLFLAAT